VRQPRALSTHDPQALTELPIFAPTSTTRRPCGRATGQCLFQVFGAARGAEMEQFGVKGINVM
jgi:hypothetical protein